MAVRDTGKDGFDALMDEVCVGLGFCGTVKDYPLHVTHIIPTSGPVTADQFVDWVFLADDMNPNVDRERWAPIRHKIRAAFVKFMGAETVDATMLQWDISDEAMAILYPEDAEDAK